ncbi:MAG: hypothetical protein CM15mP129_10560 [Chloroflexota bacterium]|nr:MAG: hypothetical protein CM15mP129_10560 [Chloroflexota bacterium]
MDFNLTEEQITFQNSVRSLADKYLKKDNLRRAHDPLFPKDIAKLFSNNGLMGITLPEKDGGQGGNLMDAVLAIEQVALICPSADVTTGRLWSYKEHLQSMHLITKKKNI